MKLPKIYNQGQLFAFSGLDGESTYNKGLCGYLLGDRVGVQFILPFNCSVFLADIKFKSLDFEMVSGDCVVGCADGERISLIAYDQYTLVGQTGSKAKADIYAGEVKDGYFVKLKTDGTKFSFAYGTTEDEAEQRACNGLKADCDTIINQRKEFILSFDYNGKYEELCGKFISVMKTQIYTPEGIIKSRWSTPDRFPHRSMWLWDSVFHAIGFRHIDTALAQELVEAIFTKQEENGFIPHFTNPVFSSQISQPPVIAYGALKVYEKSEDKAFLERIYKRNKIFLKWCEDNRRKTDKQLYTWLTEPDLNCRCGESGMDNSTRFDTTDELLAIDFSCFVANECRCMAEIADILSLDDEKACWEDKFNICKNDINETLWDEESKFYYDRTIDGRLHNVVSVASFLPLFCGICSDKQAKALVDALEDENQFGTTLPVPTIAKNSPFYGDDMWRGPVWINFNYFIAEGLEMHGYKELADKLNFKTIEIVEKYYKLTGCIYEFYDSEDKVPPSMLNRKGTPVVPYNPFVRYQTIRDYGWSVTLTFDLINKKSQS